MATDVRELAPSRPRSALQKRVAPPLDVLEARIHVPEPRAGTVSRTALVNRLRTLASSAVVTISAPAGYGKTTVLAQWATRDARPFAWVSLDPSDNDPVVLLRHVGAALDAVEDLSTPARGVLGARGSTVWKSGLPRLTGWLVSREEPLVLVLDDAHLVRSKEALQLVSVLADHLGEGSLLVLAGRALPRLPLASMRAAGRLVELGGQQLALDRREAQLLLHATGIDLDLVQAASVVDRCEGWAAGLYLASLAVRDEEDERRRTEQLVAFRGDDRYLSDYFRDEYLSNLRPAQLRFLRRTSILERMSGALCDVVLGESGSARELEKIERSNLFLSRSTGGASGTGITTCSVTSCSASCWRPSRSSFRVSTTAPRTGTSGAATSSPPSNTLGSGATSTALRRSSRRSRCPCMSAGASSPSNAGWPVSTRAARRRYPGVALMGAWVHALRGRTEAAVEWLAAAESGSFEGVLPDGSGTLEPWLAVLRAVMCCEGVQQMIADVERALADLPAASLARPCALTVQGAAYILLGQPERADEIFRQAAREAEHVGATDARVLAISERSLLASTRGDAVAAETLATEAADLVESENLGGYVTSVIALATSARAQLRHGEWDSARAQLAKAQLLRPLLQESAFPWFAIQARLELARSYLALRDKGTARSLLAEVTAIIGRQPHVASLVGDAEALQEEIDAIPETDDRAGTGLTGAQLRLLPLLATHLSFREIGERLFVSRNTIKTQAISVYRKLGVSSRSDAIQRAGQLGLVDPAGGPA